TGIRMTLDGAGNVGIGTPSPGRRLHVAGSVAIDGLNPIEFGRGFTKEISAGQIGYGTHSGGASGSLDIVGAGTTGNNRRVTIWSGGRMQVYGGVDVQGGLRARGGVPGGNGVNNNGYAFTGNGGDNDSGMFSEADGVLQFFSNSGERMRINSNGRVGIGTSDPVTRLHVTSWVNRFINTRYFNRNGGLNASDNIEISIGIKAEGGVEALGFYAVSDERIKEVVGRSDTARDLEVVRRLSVKDYRMKDTAEHGETLHKGVIAQEVRIVMPEAVNQGRGFIPSIYAVADTKAFDSTAKTLRVGLSGAHQLKAGDRVRLISDDSIEAYTVAAVPDERTFVVSDVFKAPERLFVYGVEVADFLSVDYDRLFTAGIGAIQELAKQVEALRRSEARVAELEQKVARMETLQTEVAELKQRMNQFAALEQMLREVMDARNAEGAARLRPVSGQPPVARR
ncbi:MAG TPA: tail fiber domain-containing protein, partial [Verrucomicrobiota bacterium]|nr:tail fiber domain-containing protein [Verrucomicrobiota bacterium]